MLQSVILLAWSFSHLSGMKNDPICISAAFTPSAFTTILLFALQCAQVRLPKSSPGSLSFNTVFLATAILEPREW